VKEFIYMGWILERNDNEWPAINGNLKRTIIAWGRIGKIFKKERAEERAEVKSMTSIYKAIVQAVLLYGAESWIVTTVPGTGMQQKLASFHHRSTVSRDYYTCGTCYRPSSTRTSVHTLPVRSTTEHTPEYLVL
jgi:hypothetical protein